MFYAAGQAKFEGYFRSRPTQGFSSSLETPPVPREELQLSGARRIRQFQKSPPPARQCLADLFADMTQADCYFN